MPDKRGNKIWAARFNNHMRLGHLYGSIADRHQRMGQLEESVRFNKMAVAQYTKAEGLALQLEEGEG
jgi:hypothetical protein